MQNDSGAGVLSAVMQERYSTRELERQIKACVYERVVLSPNVAAVKAQLQPQDRVPFGEGVFRDQYVFEFLNLPERHTENDLQRGLIEHLKQFILELGRDFTFVGEEYRLQVGMRDFRIDLLFFHRDLRCLVASELKSGPFEPEYLGKLNFYVEGRFSIQKRAGAVDINAKLDQRESRSGRGWFRLRNRIVAVC